MHEFRQLRKLMVEALESRSLLAAWGGSCTLEASSLDSRQSSDSQLVALDEGHSISESSIGEGGNQEDNQSDQDPRELWLLASQDRPTLGGLVAEGEPPVETAGSGQPILSDSLVGEGERQDGPAIGQQTTQGTGFGPQRSVFQPIFSTSNQTDLSIGQATSPQSPNIESAANSNAASPISQSENDGLFSGMPLGDASPIGARPMLEIGTASTWDRFTFDTLQPDEASHYGLDFAEGNPEFSETQLNQQVVLSPWLDSDRSLQFDPMKSTAESHEATVDIEQPTENPFDHPTFAAELQHRAFAKGNNHAQHAERSINQPSSRLVRQLLRLGGGMLAIESGESASQLQTEIVQDSSPSAIPVSSLSAITRIESTTEAVGGSALAGNADWAASSTAMETEVQQSWLLQTRSLLAVFVSGLCAIFIGMRKQKRFDEFERARLEKLS